MRRTGVSARIRPKHAVTAASSSVGVVDDAQTAPTTTISPDDDEDGEVHRRWLAEDASRMSHGSSQQHDEREAAQRVGDALGRRRALAATGISAR